LDSKIGRRVPEDGATISKSFHELAGECHDFTRCAIDERFERWEVGNLQADPDSGAGDCAPTPYQSETWFFGRSRVT
jgi:hypothetical protein